MFFLRKKRCYWFGRGILLPCLVGILLMAGTHSAKAQWVTTDVINDAWDVFQQAVDELDKADDFVDRWMNKGIDRLHHMEDHAVQMGNANAQMDNTRLTAQTQDIARHSADATVSDFSTHCITSIINNNHNVQERYVIGMTKVLSLQWMRTGVALSGTPSSQIAHDNCRRTGKQYTFLSMSLTDAQSFLGNGCTGGTSN